ncbi:MAG: hypothetical protein K6F21_04340 [Bacteroidales bacterium]|nr:hypothetical protein [Bacteroidales bacterium]
MKKFLVVCTALSLLCLPGVAQEYVREAEADNAGRSVGLSIIPRFDLNYDGDFTLGDSSLYSLFEGSLSDNLSFSICNHWLASDAETISALYQNTFRSDDVNWLDWANLTYSFGSFSVTLGKQALTFGGFEFDAYDFEAYSFLGSSAWNDLQVYQWGAKFDWTNESENTTLSLQATSSPFGEHPFSSKLFNYALEWRGEYGSFRNIWSAVAMETEAGSYLPLLSFGQEFDLNDNVTLGLDIYNIVGDEEEIAMKGLTMIPSLIWKPCESVQLRGRLGGEINRVTKNKDLIVGFDAHWYPIKDNEDLRLHLATGYHHDLRLCTLNIGVLYYLNFPRS